ncbi:Receptor-type tyrosine-protein phosphatase zeta [Zancudomyces culisetae]|uniref:Receptor-type tyrosine-protein phosphatase zeta n=1 Tax=Zancudomyces culisetae TaxID=1213189 RepID=A0A1R1PL86_ZANCU|nr:Receptor-type tyrosine-protein phosphatase zeta [Zancudomyces culisetae]|eukprot:OMH81726.1 Receptor-type tyrosine-protein phosphatase zeta [Zancudomyces culisetae]
MSFEKQIKRSGFKRILSKIAASPDRGSIREKFGIVSEVEEEIANTYTLQAQYNLQNNWSQSVFAQRKNRYYNIYPYDYNRVILNSTTKPICTEKIQKRQKKFEAISCIPQNDLDLGNPEHERDSIVAEEYKNSYINASWIMAPSELPGHSYIATQGPLKHTAGCFWQMVYERKVQRIVMLTKCNEKKMEKCSTYWPTEGIRFNNFTENGVCVSFLSENIILDGNAIERKFEVFPTNTQRGEQEELLHGVHIDEPSELLHDGLIVTQYCFMDWPDSGIPSSSKSIIDLIKHVRTTNRAGVELTSSSTTEDNNVSGKALENTSKGPTIVHCSAGVGRTGTWCVLDSCIEYLEKFGEYDGDLIFDLFLFYRRQRVHMVQTSSQLSFIYKALHFYLDSERLL